MRLFEIWCVCVQGSHRTHEGHCSTLESSGPRAKGQKVGFTYLSAVGSSRWGCRCRVWEEARPPPGPGAWGPAPVLVRRPRSVARRSLLGGSSSATLCLLLLPAPPWPRRAVHSPGSHPPPPGPASPVLLSHLSSRLLSPHPSPPSPRPCHPQTPPPPLATPSVTSWFFIRPPQAPPPSAQ